jgi:hypothetical protein
MILICKRCQHIGLGDFDNAAITWAAPLLVSSMLLVEYSTKYNSVPVMLSMVRIFEYATDMTITAMSYEDSCNKCNGSRSMVPVYSDEGIQIIVDNDIDFPIEDIRIEVSIPT